MTDTAAPYEFDADTAVRPVGPNLYMGHINTAVEHRSRPQRRVCHGRRHGRLALPRCRSRTRVTVTAHYLRPSVPGPVRIHVDHDQSGSAVRHRRRAAPPERQGNGASAGHVRRPRPQRRPDPCRRCTATTATARDAGTACPCTAGSSSGTASKCARRPWLRAGRATVPAEVSGWVRFATAGTPTCTRSG